METREKRTNISDWLEPERPQPEAGGYGAPRATWAAALLFYLLVALEVIIMVTPFTVYFYSIYAPVLNRLESSPWTAWATAFFLPHITYTGDPLLVALAVAAPLLVSAGLAIFLVAAAQVYGAKLFRRGVVSGWLYSRVRHPQYLGLAIAGLGLLLYWPRFFILVAYVSMLFVYLLLARNEEARMLRKFGEGYASYLRRTAMFLPGGPGARIYALIAQGFAARGVRLLGLYVGALAVAVAAAFGLRAYSISRVPVFYGRDLVAVSTSPTSADGVAGLIRTALDSPEVAPYLAKFHRTSGHTLVAYVLPQDYMMQHLLADQAEHEAHHGRGEQGGFGAILAHLGEMYLLKPMRQLRAGQWLPEKRVIFTEPREASGAVAPPDRVLSTDVTRIPLFFADLDAAAGKVTLVMETPRRHAWGDVPVPAF